MTASAAASQDSNVEEGLINLLNMLTNNINELTEAINSGNIPQEQQSITALGTLVEDISVGFDTFC
jgi:hypothetical protein